jgi:predicted porin
MKRSLVTITIMMALVSTANAAVETGDLDLNFGFSWTSENGASGVADRSSTDLSFGVDYFVTNRISLGVAYGYYDFDQTSNAATNTQTETTWSLRIKYYILKRERLLPYIGFAYKFYDYERKLAATSSNSDDTGTAFLAGLRYALTERNHAYLEYQHNSYGDKWPTSQEGGSKILIGLIHQVN